MRAKGAGRRGIAMIPTLLAVAGLSIFALALLTSVLSANRSANHQADDYRLSSSVESVSMLATEVIWSGYLESQPGGQAGTITTFRNWLTTMGVPDSGPGGSPEVEEGTDMIPFTGIPVLDGKAMFQDVTIDALQVVRRDEGDATQLYLTVSASTNRGAGLVHPVLNRAVQQVYTIEPEEFEGFDYAVLANNVNCIFCHTNVDSADRYFNTNDTLYDSFDRVKVGSLETLMLRHFAGAGGDIGDWDADSYIAGSLYVRGSITDGNGAPLAPWSELAFQGYEFDTDTGTIVEDTWGLGITPFSPAGDPPDPLENLYLGYPEDYALMVDGALPIGFPAPIPDDGGIDPATLLPDPTGAGNKVVDDFEFLAAAEDAEGAITAGIINLVPPGEAIDDDAEYTAALEVGNKQSVQQNVEGNLILTGTLDNPITIDGTLAIDGDVLINGYVTGEGSLVVRGNIYIPTDLAYLDGQEYLDGDEPGFPTGPRTFGIAEDGTKNALGLAAGGNVMIGDYLAPASLQWDGSKIEVPIDAIIDGSFDPTATVEDNKWNFALAETSLFNRAEWAKTQEFLPGAAGHADDFTDGTIIDGSTGYPETWLPNPDHVPDYTPRYYHFGPDDEVPIYNLGNIYYDQALGTWLGDAEVPIYWDTSLLTIADPTDLGDPVLYPASGNAPVLKQMTPTGGWITDDLYKGSIEDFELARPFGKPMSIDGLVYTNNSIFSIVNRNTTMFGRMVVNGALIAADIGMLVPGYIDPFGLSPDHSPLSDYAIGLQLNYDKRVKDMLNVTNPLQVQLKRTLWNPTANLL